MSEVYCKNCKYCPSSRLQRFCDATETEFSGRGCLDMTDANGKGLCRYYKRKWYKFWRKEGSHE